MDDIKLPKRKRIRNHITDRIYNQDIGMEFAIEKCAMLVIKSGTEKIEEPNEEKIRIFRERETYKYLGKLEEEMKENKWR